MTNADVHLFPMFPFRPWLDIFVWEQKLASRHPKSLIANEAYQFCHSPAGGVRVFWGEVIVMWKTTEEHSHGFLRGHTDTDLTSKFCGRMRAGNDVRNWQPEGS
jgi:hypothetical protein